MILIAGLMRIEANCHVNAGGAEWSGDVARLTVGWQTVSTSRQTIRQICQFRYQMHIFSAGLLLIILSVAMLILFSLADNRAPIQSN